MTYKISVDAITWYELRDTLGIPEPKGSYDPGKRTNLASGKARDLGLPRVRWHWDFLNPDDRDTLRLIITGPSTDPIYIETLTNETLDAFDQFETIALWPEGNENLDSHHRMDFNLDFLVVGDAPD